MAIVTSLNQRDFVSKEAVQTFETVADMQACTWLTAGMTCHTNGNATVGDGGAAYYKVAASGDIALQGGLYATQVLDKADSLSSALGGAYKSTRYTNAAGSTDIYYAIIPSTSKPTLCLANGTADTTEHEIDAAFRTKSDILINAGVFNASTGAAVGPVIVNGEVVKNAADSASGALDHSILYMTTDGVLNATADSAITASDLLQQEPDIVWAVTAFQAIVRDGTVVVEQDTTYHPRSIIAQDANGNYLVMSCGGRTKTQVGITPYDAYEFMLSIGFTPYFAFNMDGGASVGLTAMGIRDVPLVDNTHRKQANFIAFKLGNAVNERDFDFNYPAALAIVEKMKVEQYQYAPLFDILSSVNARHFGFRYPNEDVGDTLECVMQYTHSTRTFAVRTLDGNGTLTDVMTLSTDAQMVGGKKVYTEGDYTTALAWSGSRAKDTDYEIPDISGAYRLLADFQVGDTQYQTQYIAKNLNAMAMPAAGATIVLHGFVVIDDGTVIPINLTVKNTSGTYYVSYAHSSTKTIRLMKLVASKLL